MKSFVYQPVFQPGKDSSPYRLLSAQFVSKGIGQDQEIVSVEPQALVLLAKEAFKEISFYYRSAHLKKLRNILDDPEASDNDRFVAHMLLKNAVVSAQENLPSCQDTGTAVIYAEKGESIRTAARDREYLSQGIFECFQERNLRYSQLAPLSLFEEQNTQTNLPAQIDIQAVEGREYRFLFIAKGGGSANRTFLYQENKSVLNEKSLADFLRKKLSELGTAACPPYHLVLVIGGTSADETLKCVKLASSGYFDSLPETGDESGRAFRDLAWEQKALEMCYASGIGAQFGGKYLVHDVRVIRLPRHTASCPIGIGVGCSADRNIRAKITAAGIFLEELEKNPARFLPDENQLKLAAPVSIDLDRPLKETLAELSRYPVKTRLSLSGNMIVARDTVHAKLRQMLDQGKSLPDYFRQYPVYYAGPAKTPRGSPTGSFGPTTAERMDSYAEDFMKAGASLITIAKGNRSEKVTAACKKYGGFYLGSVGGPAAVLAKENILSSEVIDFEDLGMESVRKIRVRNFPAFIVCDDKGNNFFSALKPQP